MEYTPYEEESIFGDIENKEYAIENGKKALENENVINQGLFYLDWLLDHKADFKLLVMDVLGQEKADAIDWSMPCVICIANDFTKFDEHAVNQMQRNIKLVRYRKFGDNLIALEHLNAPQVQPISDDNVSLPSKKSNWKDKSQNNRDVYQETAANMPLYNAEKFLEETIESIRKQVQDKLLELNKDILKEIQNKKLELFNHANPKNTTSLTFPCWYNKGKVNWLGVRYGKHPADIRDLNKIVGARDIDDPKYAFQKHACMQVNVGYNGVDVGIFHAVPNEAIDREYLHEHIDKNDTKLLDAILNKLESIKGYGYVWNIWDTNLEGVELPDFGGPADPESTYYFDNENKTYYIEKNVELNSNLNINISLLEGTENIVKNGRVDKLEVLKFVLFQDEVFIWKEGFRNCDYYIIKNIEDTRVYLDKETFIAQRTEIFNKNEKEYRVTISDVNYRMVSKPDLSKYKLVEK